MKKLLSTKLSENKQNYTEFLFKFWNLLKKWKIKNQEDVRKILADFDIDEKIKKKFLKTFEEKRKVFKQKEEKLKKFAKSLINSEDKLIKQILLSWWKFIQKDFVWGFVLPKQAIWEIFFKNTDWLDKIDEIWFYLKDYSQKLWFDLIVVSDEKLIDHEYKEAFFELFLNQNIKRFSLFNFSGISESENAVFNGVLTDIFLHLLSLGSKYQIQKDLEKYIKYVNFAILNNESKKETLLKIKTYLNYLLNVVKITDEEKILKWLLVNLSYPSKLLTYLTDGNVDFEQLESFYKDFKNLIPQIEEIKNMKEFQLFNLLSSNKFDVRYCTIITRKVTHIETQIIKEKNKRILRTPLNIKNPNIEYVLNLYLENLKTKWEITSYEWSLKSWITLYRPDWLKDKVIILQDGYIWIESEYVDVKQRQVKIDVEQKIDDRGYKQYLLSQQINEEELSSHKYEEWWLTSDDVAKIANQFAEIENQEKEKITAQTEQINIKFEEDLSYLMEDLTQQALDLWIEENELIQKQQEQHKESNQDLVFYETAVEDAIKGLNNELKKQYGQSVSEDEIWQYLFKELEWFRKVQETDKEKVLRLVFSRYHIVWSEDIDQLVVDIIIDKQTGQVKIKNDWQGMCSAHQFFDDYFNQYLYQIWWIQSWRIDQKQTNWEIANFQKQKNLDTNIL